MVEFEDIAAARMAVNIETGFPENKLKVKPLWEEKTHCGVSSGVEAPSGAAGGVSSDFVSLESFGLTVRFALSRILEAEDFLLIHWPGMVVY